MERRCSSSGCLKPYFTTRHVSSKERVIVTLPTAHTLTTSKYCSSFLFYYYILRTFISFNFLKKYWSLVWSIFLRKLNYWQFIIDQGPVSPNFMKTIHCQWLIMKFPLQVTLKMVAKQSLRCMKCKYFARCIYSR